MLLLVGMQDSNSDLFERSKVMINCFYKFPYLTNQCKACTVVWSIEEVSNTYMPNCDGSINYCWLNV